jgi:bifunctional DNA-binding transcriptional regulator/antitoxin component of YhaV-PrlF toxin-antitoxin module
LLTNGRVRFKIRLQLHNRFTVPKYVRQLLKIESDRVLQVQVDTGVWGCSQIFHSRITKDGRIVIPKLIMGLLEKQNKAVEGKILEITLETV